MFDIEIINSMVFCVSLIIFTNFYIAQKKEILIKNFIFLMVIKNIIYIYFRDIALFSTYFCLIITIIFVNKEIMNFRKSLFIVISALSIIQAIVSLYGSVLFLITSVFPIPNLLYNLTLSVFLLITSYMIVKFVNKKYLIINSETTKIINLGIVVKITFLAFQNIIIPYLPIVKDKVSYAIISFTFVVFYILQSYLFYMIRFLEIKESNFKLKITIFEKKIELSNQKYNEIILLKHYYTKLFNCCIGYINNNDFDGFKEYFNKYITPINQKLLSEEIKFKKINSIDNDLIKLLLFEASNRSLNNENIKFDIDIMDSIIKINLNELELFKMISIFIDNAFEEVERQEDGYIKIIIFYNDLDFNFIIKNSLEEKSKDKVLNSHRGLEIAKKIASENNNIFLSTKKGINYYVQYLTIRGDA